MKVVNVVNAVKGRQALPDRALTIKHNNCPVPPNQNRSKPDTSGYQAFGSRRILILKHTLLKAGRIQDGAMTLSPLHMR